MLKLITRRNCHFGIKDNAQRSVKVFANCRITKNHYSCSKANRVKINFSQGQYCENQSCSAIVSVNKNKDHDKSIKEWNVISFILLAVGVMGYVLVNNKASADEDADESKIDGNSLQSKEELDGLSLRLTEGLPAPVENYVDLQGKKELLDEKLKNEDIIVISGAGGMGKSTLATQYGNECQQRKDTQVIWIKGTQIEEEFFRLGEILGIATQGLGSEMIRNLVYGNLESLFKNKHLLFIFDNVETQEKIAKYLINIPTTAKVIITARNDDLLVGIKAIKVKGFNKEEASFYLKATLKVSEGESKEIINTVSESPFRLSVVVAYLKNHPLMKVEEFIKIYLRYKENAISNEEIYPEVEMVFGDLKNKSPQGWEMLKYLAYMDAEGVMESFIREITKQTRDELEEAINNLRELSLIKIVHSENEITLKITHRIVQGETKKALVEEDDTQIVKILEKLISELNKVMLEVDRNPEKWKEASQWIKHGEVVMEEVKKNNISFIERKEVAIKLAAYNYYIKSNYKEAIKYWEEVLECEIKLYPGNHPDVANSLNHLGMAYQDLRGEENVRRGLEYIEEGLKMRQALYPGNHPDLARSLNNVGRAYAALEGEENMRQGLGYLEEGLKMMQALYPGNHPDLALSLSTVGSAYNELGGEENMRRGLEYLEEGLKMMQAFYLGNHPDSAESLSTIGMAYRDLGGEENVRRGLEYLEEGLKMSQAFYPGNHPSVANLLNNVGLAYRDLGGEENMRQGLGYLEEGLKMSQAFYPGNHPSVANSLNNVGMAYRDLGGEENVRRGLGYLEEGLKMSQAFYPGNHPSVANSLNNVGLAYRDLGGEENVRQGLGYLEEGLKMSQALYPGNHPSVANLLNNVGMAYQDLGGEENVRRGLEYLEEVLKMSQALYPGNHPDLARSLNNVGLAYQALGGEENVRQGLEYLEEGLKMSQALYPGNHPDLARSLNNVGLAYQALGGEENVRQGLGYLEEGLKMSQALYSGNHLSVANLLNNVGMAYRDLGGEENVRQGLEYLEEGLKMSQAFYPGNHPSVAASLNNVGLAYRDLGGEENVRQGSEYLEEGLKMSQALYPGNHPDFVKKDNRSLLIKTLRSFTSQRRVVRDRNYYWDVNRKRKNFSVPSDCKNNDPYKGMGQWNIVYFFLLVIGMTGYVLVNSKANADEEKK